ncbi:MAG: cytochrome P450 [Pseudomonadota bacterium]|nr:cytochrome P450 [Pseudomonadota bacterium]
MVWGAGEAQAAAREFDMRRLPPKFYLDPYPVYRALREAEPVKRLPDGSLFLSRYDDLVAVYKDAATFSSDKRDEFRPKYGDSPLYEHHTTSLVFNDAPLHTRVRRLIAGALTPRAIAALAPDLEALVAGLLDAMAGRAEVDLIEDFAAKIPVEVIGNLLAVPHDERGELRAWSLAILGALEPAPSVAALDAGNRAVTAMSAYLDGLIAARRARPGDPARDVLTRLLQGEDGERLGPGELIHNCIFLLNAGHETTTNLIGNALALLCAWEGERRRLIGTPDLIGPAIEEFLRFESSNQLGNRRATRAAQIGGVQIEAGQLVTLGIGAANRDPAAFADPERLDVARSPNRHLAFAAGPHQCAGLALARLEGRVALSAFLRRYPRYALAGAPALGGRARFRGFLKLPARLG